ncbi:hypothetical protein N7510_000838 [Penicillium lagena]|uniref:uncharacterized protein n=1 Tax=Penicillium lagena TaxID=94218 RepID=UPI002540DFA0|nr:uncharacterized protein N7510_000838 [Penicillium lagena]KAJ5624529.1 hypothetical protein N7510_000838 [Penicillium lagena]
MSRKPADVASKERNEYIPSFISKKPFYVDDDSGNDYLEHQRLQKATQEQSKWYDRGKRAGPAVTKYRKGACENCGAMTHKTKECLSRPRKQGAKWTGKDIQADEVIQTVDMGWDAKRDRWNGYDASEYRKVVNEYEELEAMKRAAKDGEGLKMVKDGEEDDDDDSRPADELRYAEESDMGRQQSTATRNLRIREDTAKYLLNLDLDSAKYDPKTRRMVDMGAQEDQAAALVAEENFIRASGDAAEFEKAQTYAWESQESGRAQIHLQANPTSGEVLRKKEKSESEAKRQAQRKALLDKYGGFEHLQPTPLRDTMVVENERFVEYDESGAIKGAPKRATKSKYAEDVMVNNHTSVWGSWWHEFQWGYTCCFSTVKNSYCTGEEGKKAFEEAGNMLMLPENGEESPNQVDEPLESEPVDTRTEEKANARKRTLAEVKSGITEEEIESYKRSRLTADDPMAKFIDQDL